MSQVKRYFPENVCIQSEMIEDDNADWVRYSDYASLAAENERLRKAGDWLETWAKATAAGEQAPLEMIAAWNAAKKGGAK